MVAPGCVYGLLTVVSDAGWHVLPCGVRTRTWLCTCACGNEHVVIGSNLASGGTRSCGCARGKHIGDRIRTHGKRGTAAYKVWNGIMNRCTNPNTNDWENYGGRGIGIDPRWRTFEGFYADMGDPPAGMSIDRRDTNGDYTYDNCRWADVFTQNRNRRAHKRSKSGVSGVVFGERRGEWLVSITANYKTYHGGWIDNLLDAVALRYRLEREHWNEDS